MSECLSYLWEKCCFLLHSLFWTPNKTIQSLTSKTVLGLQLQISNFVVKLSMWNWTVKNVFLLVCLPLLTKTETLHKKWPQNGSFKILVFCRKTGLMHPVLALLFQAVLQQRLLLARQWLTPFNQRKNLRACNFLLKSIPFPFPCQWFAFEAGSCKTCIR